MAVDARTWVEFGVWQTRSAGEPNAVRQATHRGGSEAAMRWTTSGLIALLDEGDDLHLTAAVATTLPPLGTARLGSASARALQWVHFVDVRRMKL